jgi:hypothetical protein
VTFSNSECHKEIGIIICNLNSVYHPCNMDQITTVNLTNVTSTIYKTHSNLFFYVIKEKEECGKTVSVPKQVYISFENDGIFQKPKNKLLDIFEIVDIRR